jgi:Spy/CpxP family protein refolding chaperone
MLKMALLAAASGSAWLVGLGAWTLHEHGGLRCHRARGANVEMVRKFVDFAVTEKLDAIDATPEQRQKVREIKDRLMKEGRELHEGKEGVHEQLMTLWAQDDPDPARVRAVVRERTDALVRFADDATDAMLELHKTFTPEQRAKLLQEAREHMGRRGH